MQDEGDCYFEEASRDGTMPPEPPFPPMYLPNPPELFTIGEAVMQMFEMDPCHVYMERGLYNEEYPIFDGLPAAVERDIVDCIQFDDERRCICLCEQFCWPNPFGDRTIERAKFPKEAFYEVWLRISRHLIPLPKWLQECHDPYAFAEPDPQPEGGQMSAEEEGSAGYWAGLQEEASLQTECVRDVFIGKNAGRRKGAARGGRPKGDPHRWVDAAKRCLPQLMQRPERCRTRQLLYELMADLTGYSAEHCKRQLYSAEKEEGRRIDVKKGGMGQKPQG